MSDRQKKLYGKSPKMERDDEGKMGVKTPTAEEGEAAGTEGVMHSVPSHMANAMERQQMHTRHEQEHMMHDATNSKGDKKSLHAKHMAEAKAMYDRHEKEMSGGKQPPDGKQEKMAKSESEGKEYKGD